MQKFKIVKKVKMGRPKKQQKSTKKPKIVIQINPFLIENEKGKVTVNIDKFAQHLITKYSFKTLYGKVAEELLVFDNSIFQPEKAKEIIKTECEKELGKHCKNFIVLEVLEKIKRLTPADRKKFDNIPLHLIPLENGIYDLESKSLIKFSPIYPFRFKIPISFDINADCPNFLKYLGEVLYEDDRPVVQEWLGYLLYRRYFIKKGMIFVGEKDTGKTVLLNAIIKFIGHENTSGINLQRVSYGDKFGLAALYNKHLNVYDDLSAKDVSDGGGFKICTGGGYQTAEYKFGDSFTFCNFAKLLFACNKIPPIKDVDDNAYYDRWMPIQFDNVIPETEQDKFLIDKLSTPAELSGLLNWALIGLERLLKAGHFSFNKNQDEVKRIMERSGNPLAGFVQDVLEEKAGNRITKELMFEAYSIWAKIKGMSRLSKEQLGRQLEKICPFILAKRDKERYWEGTLVNFSQIRNQVQNKEMLDTLDAFLKIYKQQKIDSNNDNNNDVINNIDMYKNKASKVSPTTPVVLRNNNLSSGEKGTEKCEICESYDTHKYEDAIVCFECGHRKLLPKPSISQINVGAKP